MTISRRAGGSNLKPRWCFHRSILMGIFNYGYSRVMKILIISCSLNPQSRSLLLAVAARDHLASQGRDVQLLDLREQLMPLCDGGSVYEDERVQSLRAAVAGADAVLLAAPVYNFDLNAAAKNLIELTGDAWTNKVVGFLCAAGGSNSYMAVMGLANSLMLDFRCLIIPRFVYAVRSAFADGRLIDEQIKARVVQLCDETVRIAGALQGTAQQ